MSRLCGRRFVLPLVVILTTLIGTIAVKAQHVSTDSEVPAKGSSKLSNVRFTPPVAVVPPDAVGCSVLNITSVTRSVHAQLFILAPEPTPVGGQGSPLPVDPGGGLSIGVAVSGGGGTFYCKFTVVDGTRADIRGSLQIIPGGGGSEKISVLAE